MLAHALTVWIDGAAVHNARIGALRQQYGVSELLTADRASSGILALCTRKPLV